MVKEKCVYRRTLLVRAHPFVSRCNMCNMHDLWNMRLHIFPKPRYMNIVKGPIHGGIYQYIMRKYDICHFQTLFFHISHPLGTRVLLFCAICVLLTLHSFLNNVLFWSQVISTLMANNTNSPLSLNCYKYHTTWSYLLRLEEENTSHWNHNNGKGSLPFMNFNDEQC